MSLELLSEAINLKTEEMLSVSKPGPDSSTSATQWTG